MHAQKMFARITVVAVAGGVLATLAGPAFASSATMPDTGATPAVTSTATSGSTIANLRAKCEAAVAKRTSDIPAEESKVSGNKYLTPGDSKALSEQLADEDTGLTALGVKIAGDTTLAQLKADCQAIVQDYRFYLLMIPKVNLVIAADTAVNGAGARLADVQNRLQADIDRLNAEGKNTTQAQSDLNTMIAETNSGVGSAAQVPALVLNLQPQNYVSGNEHATLVTARGDIATAVADFKQSRTDAQKVIADLKAL